MLIWVGVITKEEGCSKFSQYKYLKCSLIYAISSGFAMAQLTNGDLDSNVDIDPEDDQPLGDCTIDTTFEGLDDATIDHNVSSEPGNSCEGEVDVNQQNDSTSEADPFIDRYGFIGGNQYTDPDM